MAKTWECENCGMKMGVGYEGFELFKFNKLFCSRKCAETWVQDPNNTDVIVDALEGYDASLEDEDWF